MPPPPSPAFGGSAAVGSSLHGGGAAAMGGSGALSDATGQSEWWDAFLAGSVGGLGTGAGGGAATDKATRQPPPLSPGRADSGGGDGVTGPAASLPPGYTGMYAYAGGGKYMLSNVSETYDARMKAAQMRAALRFDEHKMSQPDQHAYEAFRQTASAFRSWRSAAATSKAEANHFRAAVNRWLLAVGFWESRLLTKCVVHWKDLRGLTDKKGDELAARHRVRELRRNLRALMEAHHAKFRENKQIVHALAFFGAGLSRRAFDAWRRSHLQAKSWFLMGEQAHLKRAFKQLRKGATGVARVAHVWIRAAGVHQDKVVRACLNRLLSHAQSMIHAQAAMAYWRNAAIHACLDHWAFLTKDAHRTLRLLRGALSHHASVLLQAIIKEWYIAVRHEVIAQNQWRRASLAVAMSRWTDAYRINVTLSACAFGFAASSESALARAYLRDWHLMTTRKQAKAAKAAAAVVHAWMSMVNYVMSMWRELVAAQKAERQSLERGLRMWASSSLLKGWNGWLSYAQSRAHYLHVAATIAASSDAGLRKLIWGQWAQMHKSSIAMREHALRGESAADHAQMAVQASGGVQGAAAAERRAARPRGLVGLARAADALLCVAAAHHPPQARRPQGSAAPRQVEIAITHGWLPDVDGRMRRGQSSARHHDALHRALHAAGLEQGASHVDGGDGGCTSSARDDGGSSLPYP